MISLVLVGDRQDIHLIGGHAKIIHNDLFLLLTEISAKSYYFSAVCTDTHGKSKSQAESKSSHTGKFFLHHKTSSLVMS